MRRHARSAICSTKSTYFPTAVQTLQVQLYDMYNDSSRNHTNPNEKTNHKHKHTKLTTMYVKISLIEASDFSWEDEPEQGCCPYSGRVSWIYDVHVNEKVSEMLEEYHNDVETEIEDLIERYGLNGTGRRLTMMGKKLYAIVDYKVLKPLDMFKTWAENGIGNHEIEDLILYDPSDCAGAVQA